LTQKVLLFSQDKVFNKMAAELFAASKNFEIEIAEELTHRKINIEHGTADAFLFFYSGKGSLEKFKSLLSKESLRTPILTINLNQEVVSFKKNRTLHFDLPINFSELCQALHNISPANADPDYCDLKFKKLYLNMTTGVINGPKNKIRLTDKEAKILWHLIDAKGLIVKQNYLLDKVWGYRDDIETNTLTTHVYTLRKKLNDFINFISIESSDGGYYIN
jgi:DNA-binding response OmpR family regulator